TGATFQCALDGAVFAACTSPKTYSGLLSGPHTFQVRASNANGTDPSPAAYSWTIGAAGGPPANDNFGAAQGLSGGSGAVAGTTYRIAFAGFIATGGTRTGNITLRWSGPDSPPPPPAAPANDNFAAAQVLSGSTGTVTGTNAGATTEPGEPQHAGLNSG